MTPSVTIGTPLAEALSNAIQPKLVEMGWSSGDDSALTEYMILMLVNGKSQEQIAGDLSNDLLGLGEGDTQALDFANWLFGQVEELEKRINGHQDDEGKAETGTWTGSLGGQEDATATMTTTGSGNWGQGKAETSTGNGSWNDNEQRPSAIPSIGEGPPPDGQGDWGGASVGMDGYV